MPDGGLIAELLAIGLLGGLLGGFLGIGGSVFFIPIMTEVLGADLQTTIAAALVVNVCVGLASTLGHRGTGCIMPRVTMILILAGVLGGVGGVILGGHFTGVWLRRAFGVFMLYIIGFTLYRVFRPLAPEDSQPGNYVGREPTTFGIAYVGALMGLASGLLGIGGGSVGVPAMQVFLRLRLRTSIACSAPALFFSCLVAAIVKHVFVTEGVDPRQAWVYVALLAPTAIVGAYVGSRLVYRMGRVWLRLVFVVFLGWVAYRMLFVA